MECFKPLELTEKGFVKPGVYFSELGNLIIFYPNKYKVQAQFYYKDEWKFQLINTKDVKLIQKVFDYEKLCEI